MIEIVVHEVRGRCPVFRVGDKIVVDGPRLVLEQTYAVCIHALPVLLHYVPALEHGVRPAELDLTRPEDPEHAYVQCPDPGEPYACGGTVVFKLRKVR